MLFVSILKSRKFHTRNIFFGSIEEYSLPYVHEILYYNAEVDILQLTIRNNLSLNVSLAGEFPLQIIRNSC